MAIGVFLKGTIAWVPDGSGPNFVPSAQSLVAVSNLVITAGGNNPNASQISAAVEAAAAQIESNFGTTNIGTVQGWAQGNP
jgi:hypothetical protein